MPGAQGYADEIQQLAPPGKAWPRDRTSQLGMLALGLGDEFGRLDASALALIEEAYPNTTNQLLDDWEALAGLPDPVIPTPTTTAGRLAALANRLLTRGDQRPVAFIAIATGQGFAATITTHTPFAAGVGYAGAALYDQASIFWFEMNITAPIGTPTPIVALEHYVRRVLPLHTYVTFNYNLV